MLVQTGERVACAADEELSYRCLQCNDISRSPQTDELSCARAVQMLMQMHQSLVTSLSAAESNTTVRTRVTHHHHHHHYALSVE